jgi:hypothetical protein
MLEMEKVTVVSDEMREVVETECRSWRTSEKPRG